MFACHTMPLCKHVFVDVGANIGMHARFLFEPEKYPKSPFSRLFRRILGDDRNQTCAIEIEPNPRHMKRHISLTRHYAQKGLTYVYLPNAVDGKLYRNLSFYLNPTVFQGNTHSDWSFGIKKRQEQNTSFKVESIPLYDVLDCMYARKTGKMIVKMDIEGMEYSVVSSLMLHGVLCRLDFLSVEWHPRFLPIPLSDGDALVQTKTDGNMFGHFVHAAVKENRHTCRLKEISNLDDETYTNDNESF
jgi:hypothetical protein